jgi:hypothetical protein
MARAQARACESRRISGRFLNVDGHRDHFETFPQGFGAHPPALGGPRGSINHCTTIRESSDVEIDQLERDIGQSPKDSKASYVSCRQVV